ncbi:MAG TPA: hypothetical protein VM536_07895 [Chloroflexia bacterium]|nr:hypothetical protein [Chloroflexia bacterium]
MTASNQQPRGVHLVGSVPLENAEQVFRTTSSILGARLRRVPDGETGVRTNWIRWQAAVLAQHPAFELVPPEGPAYTPLPVFRLRAPAPADGVKFPDLGYAAAARESYAVFARLKQEGAIPAPTRFQVSLPTPVATVASFVRPEDQPAVEPAYEARMLGELQEIVQTVPHDQLAMQWDVAVEFGILEGVWRTPGFPSDEASLVARLVRLGEAVPADVELGYHLCYGDAGHKHFVQPADTARLVSVANAIAAGLQRPLNWIHLPVPRDRDDDAYFAPLQGLQLHPETELYLGLVHRTGGEEGTRKRIAAAQRAVPVFGIGTECGMGRRPAETISELLQAHAAVAGPPPAG